MLQAIISLDYSVEAFIDSLYNPSLFSFFEFVTKFGDSVVILLVFVGIAYYLWKTRNKNLAKRITLLFFLNEVTVLFLKWFINRPRPFNAFALGELGGSFPSNHAAASIFLYGFLIYYLSKNLTGSPQKRLVSFLLFILIVLVGFSRLYLDVHYLSDVLGGYLLGAAFLSFLLRSKN